MVERIRLLLEARQLTPTQFADAIGIARPIVSHILSGRNKPSLEVVQRILAAMPDLSMAWLLNGTGPMLAGLLEVAASVAPATAAIVSEAAQIVEQQLKTAPVANDAELPTALVAPKPGSVAKAKGPAAAGFGPVRFAPKAASPTGASSVAAVPGAVPPEAPVMPLEAFPVPEGAPAPSPLVSKASEALGAEISGAAAWFAATDKPIRRIVIFYRDGSFADYQPE